MVEEPYDTSDCGMGEETCPNCDQPTNKFVGECENCGFNRWTQDAE